MRIITGRDAKFYIKVGLEFKLIMCATDVVFSFDHEEILKTSRNSGKFRERTTRLCDWGVSLSGLTKANDNDGQQSFFWLLQQSVRGTTQLMIIRYIDKDGNQRNISGDIVIKSGQLASAVASFSTATLNFPGTGAYTVDFDTEMAPTGLYKLYLDTTPGQWTVSSSDLQGAAEIMLVGRDGAAGFKEVTGVTLPVGKQFKFTDDGIDGTLIFDSTIPFNPGEIVYCEYKK